VSDQSVVCRAAFISDLHLGTRGCQADAILDFIRNLDCQTLYLVGDIIDGWKMRSGIYWPQSHNDVVQKILRLARKGVRVIYVPGNHDERLREFCGVHFGGVTVIRETIHTAADGKRFLVTHGDDFDGVVASAPWLAFVGDWAYRALLGSNTIVNFVRRRFGLGYWSLSAFLKGKVKNALAYIDKFEDTVAHEAKRRGVDGVICGIAYMNDGDWVESCTALIERFDGKFEILDWTRRGASIAVSPALLAKPAAA
jgi:UDP-2,3-diacylglucosamine pyrophosphatase LpxH